MMRVVIAGTRTFTDYALLKHVCDVLVPDGAVIMSGCARGADSLGERYAEERGLTVNYYKARWDLHGRTGPNHAGTVRNAQMAAEADRVVCFWDGVSTGTADMIEQARHRGIPCYVHRYVHRSAIEVTTEPNE